MIWWITLVETSIYHNLSVIYLTQNLFQKNQRELSLNSDWMIISKNPRNSIVHVFRKTMSWFFYDFREKRKKLTCLNFLLWITEESNRKHYINLMLLKDQNDTIHSLSIGQGCDSFSSKPLLILSTSVFLLPLAHTDVHVFFYKHLRGC